MVQEIIFYFFVTVIDLEEASEPTFLGLPLLLSQGDLPCILLMGGMYVILCDHEVFSLLHQCFLSTLRFERNIDIMKSKFTFIVLI